MASLIVTSGRQEGYYYPLGRRTNVIGRDEALPIQILDHMVSRKHLQIHFDASTNRYSAYDMKSRNGVYINNRKLEGEAVLRDGDVILIGLTGLLFADQDFQDKQSALEYYKKMGERARPTSYGPRAFDSGPVGPGETGHPIPRPQGGAGLESWNGKRRS
jgi:pSer/pThr/pTyr-binding forkhead associated (FHA) protein